MTDTTNTWLQFLAQQGAHFDQNQPDDITGFEHAGTPAQLPRNSVAALTSLGLIRASGDDAPSFLHNQLTNDVEHLGSEEARLAGYCSPKGRLLASFLIWRTQGEIYLQLPREIQAPVQKRLHMFVLRSKAKLADVTNEHACLGLSGEAVAGLLKTWFATLPPAPLAKVDNAAGSLIRLADVQGLPRYLWIAPVATAIDAWPELIKTCTPVAASVWRLTDIHAGVPQITKPTQEQFVPQMINFELIGGVNFKKGCYPGQEIVARSQYLGKLKRRMLAASIDTSQAGAGMEVFSSADPDQPCGMIVNAEPNFEGGADCLVEVKVAAAEAGTIHLGSAQGPALRFIPLPYPLPA